MVLEMIGLCEVSKWGVTSSGFRFFNGMLFRYPVEKSTPFRQTGERGGFLRFSSPIWRLEYYVRERKVHYIRTEKSSIWRQGMSQDILWIYFLFESLTPLISRLLGLKLEPFMIWFLKQYSLSFTASPNPPLPYCL